MNKMRSKIIDYFYYLATIIILIFAVMFFFKGKDVIIENALFLISAFVVWMILLNIKIYRENRGRIERRKRFFTTNDNDKLI